MFNDTPLHLAAYNGHLNVVEYLVNQRAEINLKNHDGKTPLILANKNQNKEIAKFLKKNGSEGDCRI